MSAVKDALIQHALELGFAHCRIAAAVEAPHAGAFLSWLEQGRAAEMGWLGRTPERRTDPRNVLPGAQSVIMLALNYYQGAIDDRPHHGRIGRIARYAWGEDYHEMMEPKLDELCAFLTTHGGTQKRYVDTGPLLERDFAALAGIGWHGKSTMLIDGGAGTWFFLAGILTTLELAPDPPEANRCGSCSRCMQACPTQAITAPYQLDARRCISYLTIENKGAIPEEFRRLIGDRIYGCDACLEVCPWNRFARTSREAAFAPRPFITEWPLRRFLSLDDEAFRQLFRGSPIKRIKRRGFLRNVCVALGNVGTDEDLPALEAATRDPEPLIAEHASWAVQEITRRRAELQTTP